MLYFSVIDKGILLKDEISVLEKFKGALIGCAVGDALGAPVEGMSASAIREKYGRITDFVDERFGAGLVTDDTQMTVALAQAILELGRLERDHVAFKFGRWMEFSDTGVKKARGVGMACATASRNLYKGMSPLISGLPSAGCGAAMRVSPVGLRYYHDPEELKRAAVDQATITHTHPEAAQGAVAVAFAIALGITDGGNLDRLEMIRKVSEFASAPDCNMAQRIAGLAGYIDASPEQGFAYTGNGGYVMETVPAAFFAVLRTPYDFEETVITAVNAGGDTDSIGAIAGAMSGALNGIGRIPARWKDAVEGRAYLEGLATKLYTLTPAEKPKSRPLI